MKTSRLVIVLMCSVLAVGQTISSASENDGLPPRDQVEQVLVPLRVGEFDGAFGSHFVVEMWIRNDNDQPARVFRLRVNDPRGGPPVAVPDSPIPPRTSIKVQPLIYLADFFTVGEFFWVDKMAAANTFFSLRVRDTSRSSLSGGAEVPTMRESAVPARMRVQLLNVPVEPGFRHTLRIYPVDYVRDPSIVPANRVRIFDMETDSLLVDEPIQFNGYADQSPVTYTERPYPNQTNQLMDRYVGGLQGHTKVRVELESNLYRFWAFISIANNMTQETTVITP
jgi:hypothetical protein